MNDTEKRELSAWLAEHLFGHQVEFDAIHGYHWVEPWEHQGARFQEIMIVPDYTGRDWPALAEAMRQRGWMPIVKWVPDNIPNYGTPEPHQMIPRAICEMDWLGHHQRPPRPENALAIRDQLESADTPGEAVALASKSALEAEVS